MQISDERFGAALVTTKGRTVKFDSIECLLVYYKQAASANDVASVWVSDFRHPGDLLNADSARFIEPRVRVARRWAAADGPPSRRRATPPRSASSTPARSSAGAICSEAPSHRLIAIVLVRLCVLAWMRGQRMRSARSRVAEWAAAHRSPQRVRVARPGDTSSCTRACIASRLISRRQAPQRSIGDGNPVLDGEGTHGLMRDHGRRRHRARTRVAQRRHELRRGPRRDSRGSHARVLRHRRQSHRERVLRDLSRRRHRLPHRRQRRPRRARPARRKPGTAFICGRRAASRSSATRSAAIATASTSSSCTTATCAATPATRNLRYGLHFMYSDGCQYVENTFRHNGSGVAVMYTQGRR